MPDLRFQRPAFATLMMLGAVGAYLIPHRYYPIPNFVPEALALFMAFIALAVRAVGDGFSRHLTWGLAGLSAMGLAVWVLLCMPFTKPPYPDAVVFSIVSLLAAAAVASAGASASRAGRAATAVFTVALALVGASYFTVLLQLVQYFLPDYGTAWLVPRPSALQPFGNLGQRNHAACVHALGLLGAAYLLCATPRPYRVALSLCALIALGGVVMSGSRMGSVLAGLVACAFALMLRIGREDWRPAHVIKHVAIAAAGYALVYWILSQLIFSPVVAQGFDSAATRWMTYGNLPREVLNELAVHIFLAHPITGAGWGSFSAQTLARVDDLILPQYANNSHNLITQLLAETGAVGLLLVVVPVGVVIWRAVRQPIQHERLFLLCFVGMLLTYSMSEFPLWHTFFLIPFSFALGLLDSGARQIAISRTLRVALTALCVVGVVATWHAAGQFIHIAQLTKLVFKKEGLAPEERQYVAANLQAPGFSPQTELLAFGLLAVDRSNLAGKIELGERVVRQHIDARLLSRQAALLALDGQTDAALAHLVWACRFYPERCQYVANELSGAAQIDPATFTPLLQQFEKKIPEAERTGLS